MRKSANFSDTKSTTLSIIVKVLCLCPNYHCCCTSFLFKVPL